MVGTLLILVAKLFFSRNAVFARDKATGEMFQRVKLPLDYFFKLVQADKPRNFEECAILSQNLKPLFDALNFNEGNCSLYQLPHCIDLNRTIMSELRQSSGNMDVFIPAGEQLYRQNVTPEWCKNLALGMTIYFYVHNVRWLCTSIQWITDIVF